MTGHIAQKILNDSYYDLTERAKIDLDFLLLTVAAAAICGLGFKMNSAPVIVGAMVISPLLCPVICAGAATFQVDWSTSIRAIGTFAVGFVTAEHRETDGKTLSRSHRMPRQLCWQRVGQVMTAH